ncbi:MAG: flagellar hook-length control protein FliK [Lachnospiraceae bacterium]|nr:flagellar hook-length control protein FliK [Lachnospiraceae bacterium]
MSIQVNTQGYQQNQIQEVQEILTRDALSQLKQELSLQTGQILSGRVTSMDGNNIMLLLDSKQSISAQLDGELPINVGQILSFEVKSTADSITELRPLYTNLSGTSTIGAALTEASLPMTDRNISMVEHMMEEGMSVNKQALLDMVSHLNAHPDVSPATLVAMQKLDLPMDETTIRQFENYQNFEHQIENDVHAMNDGLAALPEELLAAGDEEIAFMKSQDILEMAFAGEGNTGAAIGLASDPAVKVIEGMARLSDLLSELNGGGDTNLQTAIGEEQLNQAGTAEQQVQAQAETVQPTEDQSTQLLKLTQELLDAYKLHPENFSEEDKELLKEALRDPNFKDALSGRLNAALQLKPEEVAKDGKVEELYKRILEHADKAMDLLNNSTETAQQAAKSAQNLMDNVQFMNQLNEMMAYVQLPLKMSEENAHGDLYVYANKKKLANNDGNFSALLHLDMEHLGPMDVHVAMQQEKVSTHFYMQDEKLLDFIEANIHILNERLTKKGYQMNTQVSVREDAPKTSVIDAFLKQEDDGTVAPIVSTKSFDVRA